MDLLQALSTDAPSHNSLWWTLPLLVAAMVATFVLMYRDVIGYVTWAFGAIILAFAASGLVIWDGEAVADYIAEREQAITNYLDQERDLAVVAPIVEHEPGADGKRPPITTVAVDHDGIRYDITILFPNENSDDDLTVTAVPVTQTPTS